MSIVRALLAGLAFASISLGAFGDAAEPARFEPAVSTLTGRVMGEFVMVPGRDMVKGVAMLFDPAITIEGNSESKKNKRAMRNVRKILLQPAADGLDLWAAAGETVTVEGVIFREYTGVFHTDVTMRVDRIIGPADADASYD